MFRQLCHENEEGFERLLLHTDVRWLSKGKCLRRFYDLYDTVLYFFKFKVLDEKMSIDLESRREDVAYLSNIFSKLNEVNVKLQDSKMYLIKTKGIIMAFISKLDFYKNSLLRLDFFLAYKNCRKSKLMILLSPTLISTVIPLILKH